MIVKLSSSHPGKFVRKEINNTPYMIMKSPSVLPDEFFEIFNGDKNFEIIEAPAKVSNPVPKPAAPKPVPKPEPVKAVVEEPKETGVVKKKFFGVE